jgi:hypothetical protein
VLVHKLCRRKIGNKQTVEIGNLQPTCSSISLEPNQLLTMNSVTTLMTPHSSISLEPNRLPTKERRQRTRPRFRCKSKLVCSLEASATVRPPHQPAVSSEGTLSMQGEDQQLNATGTVTTREVDAGTKAASRNSTARCAPLTLTLTLTLPNLEATYC